MGYNGSTKPIFVFVETCLFSSGFALTVFLLVDHQPFLLRKNVSWRSPVFFRVLDLLIFGLPSLPSGKHTKNYGTSNSLMGRSVNPRTKWQFSIAQTVSHYQAG